MNLGLQSIVHGHGHGHSRRRAQSGASSTRSDHSSGDEGETAQDDTQVVEPDQGNVLMHIISQLRPGADLSRVVLPTFILEPRSMLERITNFMCHPEMLLPIPGIEDPVARFVSVVKFYLSGWHIRPPGVKKPLNPILGEIFTCYWDFPDKTRAYYVSEQTSHHPPKSSYFYMVPDHHIRVDGTLKPRSRFLGNSAASLMEGTAILSLLNRGANRSRGERYILTQPNMYARGILFGKMKYELGDHSFVRCPELGLVADIDFKTKGWVSGCYNAIGGTIKDEHTGEILYEISGLWNEEMFIRDLKTGHKEMFFSALKSKPSSPLVRPLEEQEERESQRLWQATAQAVKDVNHELATDEKTKIEDMQREEAARRVHEGVEWHPRLFRRVKGGRGGIDEGEEDLEWIINAQIDGATPHKQAEQIMAIYPIVKGQKPNRDNVIPPRGSHLHSPTEPKSHHAPQPHHEQPVPSRIDHPAKPSAAPIPDAPAGDDLIDLGGGDDQATAAKDAGRTAPRQPPAGSLNSSNAVNHNNNDNGTNEITQLLELTGQKANPGPLMDFTKDLKKDLPKAPAAMKRTSTEESRDDEFFDAQG